MSRVGLELATALEEHDDHPADAFKVACDDRYPLVGTARSSMQLDEPIPLKVVSVHRDGVTVAADFRAAVLIPGMLLDCTFSTPFAHGLRVAARVMRASCESHPADRVLARLAIVEASPGVRDALADYALMVDRTASPQALRRAGFDTSRVSAPLADGYATTHDDRAAVLELRLRAHQDDGHLLGMRASDLMSPFDDFSRHLVCRAGDEIVGYWRLTFVDGIRSRSQYASWGGHEIPDWLWSARFVEAGAAAVDPRWRRTGIFLRLARRSNQVAVQAGARFVVAAVEASRFGAMAELGYEPLERRTVEPRPGWRFESQLCYLDLESVGHDDDPTGRTRDDAAGRGNVPMMCAPGGKGGGHS